MLKKQNIVGRKAEQEVLNSCVMSSKSEFIAVYGRRRIGKTYLIKQYFKEQFDFYMTGSLNMSKSEHLAYFNSQINKYSKSCYPLVKTWFDAFKQLEHYLSTLKNKKKIIIFIDELPWFDKKNTKFLSNFELFWNSFASELNNLKLIVCGSSTTWMVTKFLGNKGGLHNRVTRKINLKPFTLKETEDFLKYLKIDWDRLQILQCYMTFGGVPYYLSLLKREFSLIQNIDYLFFSENSELKNEYTLLYSSLFNDSKIYHRIIELLATKLQGLSRKEIVEKLKITDNGTLSEAFENLVNCDFIRSYSPFKKNKRDSLFQLTDLFSLFYLKFVKNYNGKNQHFFAELKDEKKSNWYGYSFEQVCLLHTNQIKQSLGISGVASDICSWSYTSKQDENLQEKGTQIDLIIDRDDRIINICEIKYSESKYEISSSLNEKLLYRKTLFKSKTKTSKTIHLTMITTKGLTNSKYCGNINSSIILDDLFC
ncbi:MAG: AAA family ATPase [Bacteroidales bacterium]|nr:AAA family ATPase [Bacteroidales bacterium]